MTRARATIIGLTLTLVGAGIWSWWRREDPRYVQALELASEERFLEAWPLAQAVLQSGSPSPEHVLLAGFVALHSGRAEDALTIYGGILPALANHPKRQDDWREAMWWSAQAEVKLGRLGAAVSRLRALVAGDHTRGREYRLELARIEYLAGDRDGAIGTLEAAAMGDSADFETHYRLGSLLVEAGRHAEAKPWLERALALRPEHVNVYIDLALVDSALGDHAAARRSLTAAARLAPASGTVLANIGWSYFIEGSLDKAREAFLAARGLEPSNCNHAYALAWNQFTAADVTGGRGWLQEMKRLCPNMTQADEYLELLAAPPPPRRVTIEVGAELAAMANPWVALTTASSPESSPRRPAAMVRSGRPGRVEVEVGALANPGVLFYPTATAKNAIGFARIVTGRDRFRVDREADPAAALMRNHRPGDGIRSVVVVWWDGATWSVVRPLLELGRLPVLRELVEGGHAAVMDSIEPSTARALKNLTLLEHYPGYTLRDLTLDALRELKATPAIDPVIDPRLIAALARSERSIWDELRWRGLPALDLVFANYAVADPFDGQLTGADGQVVESARAGLGLSGAAEVDAGSELSQDEVAGVRAQLGGTEIAPADLRFVGEALRLVADKAEQAVSLIGRGRPRFVLVRFDETDVISHRYWAAMEQSRAGTPHPLGRAVEIVYQAADAALGKILAVLDDDDCVIVLSDHGMSDGFRHSREAIFVAYGPGIEANRADVTPKILRIRAMPDFFLGLVSAERSPAELLAEAAQP